MAHYLITGGAGFIGSSLARALLARGEHVRIIDNFSSGRRENIADFISSKNAELIEGDILDPAALRRAVEGIEVIFHEAAIPSVPKSMAEPIENHEANATGTLRVLHAARAAGVRRLVYAASSAAYGDDPTQPKVETMPPAPISPYGASKLAGEYYLQVYASAYKFETVSLRYFNVFGPRQDPASEYAAVIPKFITAALAGQTPRIFGDGKQSRDFFNIACGVAIDLNQVVALIGDILGRKVEARHEAERAGDIKHSLADIGEATRRLGYTAAVPFAEGLRRTVEWYRNKG
jgi:UDP-glucose 4-epimerase